MITINPKGIQAWVNFTFQPQGNVQSIALAGEWNDWKAEEMHRKKDGTFYKRKQLRLGRNYEFKYLIDGNEWTNDPDAPEVTNSYGSNNSLLKLAGIDEA